MNVPNVKLHFKTSDSGAETILAPNQHVYMDLDSKAPGGMRHLRSDGTGTIVIDAASPGGAVVLHDSRTYDLVASAGPLGSVPSLGTRARVAAGKLLIPAHIAVQVTSDGTKPLAGLACDLTIGASAATVRSSSTGWLLSADRTAGVVTLSVKDRVVSLGGGSALAKPTLTVVPVKPVRGDRARINLSSPGTAVAFKVTEWAYEISHQNPGSAAPSTARVVRPATESPGTFEGSWEGILCASGTAKVKWAAGVTLRASGDQAVSATVTVQDSAAESLAITVEPRGGSGWESSLMEKPEQPLARQIATFHDTGEHGWDASAGSMEPSAITDGPNRGCTFVRTAAVTFTSSPTINSLLTDATSPFSQAQDKAYLVSPPPVRVIPRRLYTVGAGGAITITDNDAFAEWILGRPLKPSDNLRWRFSCHCIDQARLLAGTRRHEYRDPDKSHKQNCLKARRALDPVKFSEAPVQLPGTPVNFRNAFQARVQAVANAGPTHDVVDEDETRKANDLRFKAGQQIVGVNSDDTANVIGPVWNPARQAEITN